MSCVGVALGMEPTCDLTPVRSSGSGCTIPVRSSVRTSDSQIRGGIGGACQVLCTERMDIPIFRIVVEVEVMVVEAVAAWSGRLETLDCEIARMDL